METAQTAVKPWWKNWKIWAGIVGVLVVIGIISNLVNPSSDSADAEPAAEGLITVPDVVGQPGDVARDTFDEAGLRIDWEAESMVLNPSNWVVASTDPAAGTEVEEGTKITAVMERPPYDGDELAEEVRAALLDNWGLEDFADNQAFGEALIGYVDTIESPEPGIVVITVSRESTADELTQFAVSQLHQIDVSGLDEIHTADTAGNTGTSVPLSETSGGVTAGIARDTCQDHGDAEFPNGFNAKWLAGLWANDVRDDQYFYKVDVEVRDAAGNKIDRTMECYVGGTADSPEVVEFLVY